MIHCFFLVQLMLKEKILRLQKNYFKKLINNKLFSKNEADYVLMTNRASFDVNNKTTCFDEFKGEDLVTVSRLGLTLSTFWKLSKN